MIKKSPVMSDGGNMVKQLQIGGSGKDLNLRSPKTTVLQTTRFDRLHTLPFCLAGGTGIEPVSFPINSRAQSP